MKTPMTTEILQFLTRNGWSRVGNRGQSELWKSPDGRSLKVEKRYLRKHSSNRLMRAYNALRKQLEEETMTTTTHLWAELPDKQRESARRRFTAINVVAENPATGQSALQSAVKKEHGKGISSPTCSVLRNAVAAAKGKTALDPSVGKTAQHLTLTAMETKMVQNGGLGTLLTTPETAPFRFDRLGRVVERVSAEPTKEPAKKAPKKAPVKLRPADKVEETAKPWREEMRADSEGIGFDYRGDIVVDLSNLETIGWALERLCRLQNLSGLTFARGGQLLLEERTTEGLPTIVVERS